MIMQRAISRRRWCPYDSVPAGRFATDVSPIRSSHTAARSSASFSARRYAGVENRPGSSPAFTLRCCATSRFSTTVSDLNRRMFWNVRAFNAILWLGSPPIAWPSSTTSPPVGL